jgi:hypothetical protein
MQRVLLVDFENIQEVKLERIEEGDYRVCVFVGESQSKIPLELVRSAQRLGDKLEWLKIDGTGRNALDFHIAYYLGVQVEKNRSGEYIILSKDKGFDPLVRYVSKQGVRCRRINSLSEMAPARKARETRETRETREARDTRDTREAREAREPDPDYRRTIDNLRKIQKAKRPRKRSTLRQHVKGLLGAGASAERVDEIIDRLRAEGLVAEQNGVITYGA